MSKGYARTVIAVAAFTALLSAHGVSASEGARSYWFVHDDEKSLWCGYADEARFNEILARGATTQSAVARYEHDVLTGLTYWIDAESGDWEMADNYDVRGRIIRFRRDFHRYGPETRIVEKAQMGGNHPAPLHIVSASPAGSNTELEPSDYPVEKSMKQFRFLELVPKLRSGAVTESCAAL